MNKLLLIALALFSFLPIAPAAQGGAGETVVYPNARIVKVLERPAFAGDSIEFEGITYFYTEDPSQVGTYSWVAGDWTEGWIQKNMNGTTATDADTMVSEWQSPPGVTRRVTTARRVNETAQAQAQRHKVEYDAMAGLFPPPPHTGGH